MSGIHSVGKCRSIGTSMEAVNSKPENEMVGAQTKVSGVLCGGGKKRLDSRYFLKVQLMGLLNRGVRCGMEG